MNSPNVVIHCSKVYISRVLILFLEIWQEIMILKILIFSHFHLWLKLLPGGVANMGVSESKPKPPPQPEPGKTLYDIKVVFIWLVFILDHTHWSYRFLICFYQNSMNHGERLIGSKWWNTTVDIFKLCLSDFPTLFVFLLTVREMSWNRSSKNSLWVMKMWSTLRSWLLEKLEQESPAL